MPEREVPVVPVSLELERLVLDLQGDEWYQLKIGQIQKARWRLAALAAAFAEGGVEPCYVAWIPEKEAYMVLLPSQVPPAIPRPAPSALEGISDKRNEGEGKPTESLGESRPSPEGPDR